jgi:hypothetical protein
MEMELSIPEKGIVSLFANTPPKSAFREKEETSN